MGEDPNCPSPSSSTLRRTIEEITGLVSLSNTIRVFSVKWQLIRKRLDELTSGLIALENSLSRSESYNLTVSELVALISHTVGECHCLASRCISVSYSGKLLMQSELDRVVSRLDIAVNILLEIYHTDGIISGGLALVVSRPPFGASKDDMRFYVRDLLTRLKIGDCEMKRLALVSINEVVRDDEKIVRIVVDTDGLVILLANCLDSNDLIVQEEAAACVEVISGFDSYKGVLVVSGVIAPLIRVVETGSFKAKEYAIRSLIGLTENGDNAWALSAHGGVTALLDLCLEHNNQPEIIGPCCCVLKNLVGVDEIKRFMIEEGAIFTFIKLIKGSDELSRIGAIEFLQALACGDENVCQLVTKEEGVLALVRILDPKLNCSFKMRETVLRAIENLCFCSVKYVNLLISYGFMDQLLYFLRNGDASIQELAFKSASRLCGTSEDARKAMGDVGFMPEFVKFLEAKSYDIREIAAEALSSMVLVPRNRKKFANDDRNIDMILQLIDPKEGNSGNNKFLLPILLSLSSCNHARRMISHSGYVKNIERLADAGVYDAKKLARKLSTNRFKSILNGIWHS